MKINQEIYQERLKLVDGCLIFDKIEMEIATRIMEFLDKLVGYDFCGAFKISELIGIPEELQEKVLGVLLTLSNEYFKVFTMLFCIRKGEEICWITLEEVGKSFKQDTIYHEFIGEEVSSEEFKKMVYVSFCVREDFVK